jgi:hypothetical protein
LITSVVDTGGDKFLIGINDTGEQLLPVTTTPVSMFGTDPNRPGYLGNPQQ